MHKFKGRRQSKNIRDITDPKEAEKHMTKAKMGFRHAHRALGTSDMGNRITTHNNIVSAESPMSHRVPLLMKDKPATKPKNMDSFKGTQKKPTPASHYHKVKTKRVK